LVKARDERLGVSTTAKRELRAGYLPAYESDAAADAWQQTGEAIVLEPVTRPVKK
jgi:hypothetical protein